MVADRFMYLAGEFEDYDAFYQEMDQHFAKGIVEVEKAADKFGQEFALNIIKTTFIISLVLGISGVRPIHTQCVTGKNSTGLKRNRLSHMSFSMACLKL